MHLMHRVLLESPVAMSLYKDMSSCNASSHFTHTLLTPSHHRREHASLTDLRMEQASILPLLSVSKAYHLFGAEHIWKEMLDMS
jgi:hypothetical protein